MDVRRAGARERFFGDAPLSAPVDEPEARGGLLIAMLSATDKSGTSESSWKMQTMPARLAAAGELKATSRSVEHDASGVRPDDARQDFDQGRLAGAVLAEDRMDPARRRWRDRRSPARARRRSASRRPPCVGSAGPSAQFPSPAPAPAHENAIRPRRAPASRRASRNRWPRDARLRQTTCFPSSGP